MKKNIDNFFAKTLCIITITLGLIGAESNAATRATAVRTPGASRRPITTTATTTKSVSVNTTTTAEPEPAADSIVTPEPTPEPVAVEQTEPIIIENKSVQFNDILSANSISSDDSSTSDLAEQIRKQRAAFDAQEASDTTLRKQQEALKFGKNACDSGLRGCMIETCGKDFTKCALDGDTMFGEKLNKCRLKTTCTGEEFRLFTTEIKADRDFNVRFASYNAVIDCGNDYKKCITTECGATFGKCLGKNAADRAIKKCATIAKNCTEQDSGLASRFGIVIGKLRETAEKDVKADEKYLYDLRELMRKQCQHLGAMFDERSLDCVYTVNFFAGENQSSPIASRKLYAGDSFICNQEWFGINATTFKENAYRETRSQTAASSAMMGAGLGTAAGLITSGAIGRAMETQAAKKDYKKECESQGGKLKDGECVMSDGKNKDKTNNPSNEGSKETNNNSEKDSQAEAKQQCKDNGGTYIFGRCIGDKKDDTSQEETNLPTEETKLNFENKGLNYDAKENAKKNQPTIGKDIKFEKTDTKSGNFNIDAKAFQQNLEQKLDKQDNSKNSTETPSLNVDRKISIRKNTQIGGDSAKKFGEQK